MAGRPLSSHENPRHLLAIPPIWVVQGIGWSCTITHNTLIPDLKEKLLMIPTLVAGIIGLIILVRSRPKAAPIPVRVRVAKSRGQARRRY
jgi:hypothetical protein